MKKLLIVLSIVFSALFMVSCKKNEKEIKLGVSFEPVTSMVKQITDDLKAKGYTLTLVHIDYQKANSMLSNGEIDLSIVQHKYFMETYNSTISESDKKLTNLDAVYYPRLGLHSKTAKNVSEIKEGTTIIIPNDPDNLARSLLFLQDLKLITLKEGITLKATVKDIATNPKNLVFREETLGTSSSAYHSFKGDVAAILYPSYARLVDNSFMKNAELVTREELNDATKAYGISIVVKEKEKENQKIKDFISVLKSSDPVKKWYKDNYAYAGDLAF